MSTPTLLPQKQFHPADIAVSNPLDIQPVYANNASVFSSPHDVRIVFTEIIMQDVKGEPSHELRASVGMSYTQAHALLQALKIAIEKPKDVQKA